MRWCHNAIEHIHEILNGSRTAFIKIKDTKSPDQKSWVIAQII